MRTQNKAKPIAVLIADVHYNINTLDIADAAMRQAISKANELDVPFIVAGDLHDTKAQLRGECIHSIILTFQTCKVPSYVSVGNHCRINEKSEAHALEFLRPYTNVIDSPQVIDIKVNKDVWIIPYHSDSDNLKRLLESIKPESLLIAHQGVQSAHMGHYVQDKTSLPPEAFADFRVVSGHYHRRQDIKCGRPRKGAVGLFSYIGNPYTLNFGEALDPPKGFQVLMDDGSLEFHPTNLRKHVVIEVHADHWWDIGPQSPEDLTWVKITGAKSELAGISKAAVSEIIGHPNFKLDLIPSDSEDLQPIKEELQDSEIMDMIIETLPDGKEHKAYLKDLWRELAE